MMILDTPAGSKHKNASNHFVKVEGNLPELKPRRLQALRPHAAYLAQLHQPLQQRELLPHLPNLVQLQHLINIPQPSRTL